MIVAVIATESGFINAATGLLGALRHEARFAAAASDLPDADVYVVDVASMADGDRAWPADPARTIAYLPSPTSGADYIRASVAYSHQRTSLMQTLPPTLAAFQDAATSLPPPA